MQNSRLRNLLRKDPYKTMFGELQYPQFVRLNEGVRHSLCDKYVYTMCSRTLSELM